MIFSTRNIQPVRALSDVPASCRACVIEALLEYNGDINRVVIFSLVENVISLTSDNEADLNTELPNMRNALDAIIERCCGDA
jgi:hypothetical protein